MIFLLAGCVSTGVKPTVLTDQETVYTIPAGVPFQATQAPTYKKLTTFTVPYDQEVMSKGFLLQLQTAADKKVISTASSAQSKGIVWGIIGTIVTVLGGLLAKFFANKASKPVITTTTK